MKEEFKNFWNKKHKSYSYSGYLISDERIFLHRLNYEKDAILKLLSGFDLKDKTVLDLGCGNGFISELFASLGAKVIATDINQELLGVNLSRAKNANISWIESDANSFLANNTIKFDLIYIGGLAPYLDNKDLKDLIDLLRNQKNLGAKIIWREIFSYKRNKSHNFIDSEGISRTLKEFNKLGLIFLTYNYGYLFQPVSLICKSKKIDTSFKLILLISYLLRFYRSKPYPKKAYRHCAFFLL